MRKAAGLALCIATLGVSCGSEPQATIAYRYEVRGTGENVEVTYLDPDAGEVHRTVQLPWISQELRGTRETPTLLEADGPEGSRVRCIVRYRRIEGVYGGNGSGWTSGSQDPDEDRTVCSV